MEKAVFLDRDGVINQPVFNLATNEYEAPFSEDKLVLYPNVIDSLKELTSLNYKLFLISNQPDCAKGKTSLENLLSVQKKLHSIFTNNNVTFCEYYYCYHHPQGIVSEYSIKCECRKPGNLFLRQAKEKYSLNMANSWMIGDRDIDIICGQSMGAKTIMIKLNESENRAKESKPNFKVNSLQEAAEIIKKLK